MRAKRALSFGVGASNLSIGSTLSRRLQTDALDITVAEYLARADDFSVFYQAVQSTSLLDLFNDTDDSATVFVPDNDAWSTLDDRMLTPGYSLHLTQLLLYHIAGPVLSRSNLGRGGTITMLNEEDLEIVVDDENVGLRNQYAQALLLDEGQVVANGIVYGLDGVLLPSFLFIDVMDRIAEMEAITQFQELLVAADLESMLREGDYTLLAPHNDALAPLERRRLASLAEDDVAQLRDVLLYHTLVDVVPSSMLRSDSPLLTAKGERISVSEINGEIVVGAARLVSADHLASNGIVHVIDTVLEPPATTDTTYSTIADYLLIDPYYSLLQKATVGVEVIAERLAATNGTQTTLFGPDDESFGYLDASFVSKLQSESYILHFENLLSYHITDQMLTTGELWSMQSIEMLNGELVYLDTSDNDFGFVNPFVDGIMGTISKPDVGTDNGVFHGITRLLLPAFIFRDLFTVAEGQQTLSLLVELLVAADLEETLRTGEHTLLAPSVEAFGRLPSTVASMLADPDDVSSRRRILEYHIMKGVFPTNQLSAGFYETMHGEAVAIKPTDEGILINDVASVVDGDLLAVNGLVHIIDTVMIPALIVGTSTPTPSPSTTIEASDSTSEGDVHSSKGSAVLGTGVALVLLLVVMY